MATKIEDVQASIAPTAYPARSAAVAAYGGMAEGAHTNTERKTVRVVVRRPGGEQSGVDVTLPGCCVGPFVRQANRLNLTSAMEVTPDAPWPADVASEATADDLRTELEAFKARVGSVAMKYARAHELCNVVEKALREIGVEPPKRQKLQLTITLPADLGFEENGAEFALSEMDSNYQVLRRFRTMLREAGISDGVQVYITDRKYVDTNSGEDGEEDED